jgi:hypothetical protein
MTASLREIARILGGEVAGGHLAPLHLRKSR